MLLTRRSLGRARIGGCLVVLACLCLAPRAHADDKKVLAQDLFDRAMALTKQGSFAEACPKFEESQKLDAQIGTLYYLGDCQEHAGKLASAWANFTDAADRAESAGKLAHAKEAQARADKLKVRLTKILLLVPADLLKAPGFQLIRDDIPIGPTLLGVPLPTDTGKHVIRVSATGKRTWETTVEVAGEGATITVAIPALQPEPEVRPVATSSPSASATVMAESAPWSAPRKVAVGLGVAGVAGLVVGGVFGGLASDKLGASNRLCPAVKDGVHQCSPEGGHLRSDALTFANVSNVGFVAGAALAAAGVVVWLASAPSGPAAKSGKPATGVAIVVRPDAATVQVRGQW